MNDESRLALLSENGMLIKRPLLISEDETAVLVGFKELDYERFFAK